MKHKSILYKKNQEDLADKIIEILNLDSDNSITLYKIDHDENKQNRIIALVPELRKYFSYNNINGLTKPEKMKRPYLSLIRQITKVKYGMEFKDTRIVVNDQIVRTKLYTFYER